MTAYNRMTAPRRFAEGDRVQIKYGPFQGLHGTIRLCNPRSMMLLNCWNYVVAIEMPNGKIKKRYVAEFDLDLLPA